MQVIYLNKDLFRKVMPYLLTTKAIRHLKNQIDNECRDELFALKLHPKQCEIEFSDQFTLYPQQSLYAFNG